MTGKVANMSHYPNGFQGGITMRDLPIAQSHSGKVFYVADGDTAGNTPTMPNRKGASDGNKGTFLAPFKTLDYAIGQCTADRGDTIIVLPGYVDTLVAASEIDVDVDGVTIIGVGSGDKQPLIQYDNVAATFKVDADNVTIQGLNFAASLTVIVLGVDVADGSDDFRMANCRFSSDAVGTAEFEDSLSITTSDRFVVEDCYFDMDVGADADSAIHVVGACLGGLISNNYVTGDYTIACIEGLTSSAEQIVIRDNTLINGVHGGLNTVACISVQSGTTGIIQDNQLYTNVAAPVTAASVAAGMFLGGGNWVSSSVETPPISLEGGAISPIVQSATNDSVLDGTDAVGLFTVLGHIYIHGFRLHTETVANSATTVGIQLDATTAAFDTQFVTDTDIQTMTTIGDYAVALTVGGAYTIIQGDDTTENAQMWNTPVVCPPGQIEWSEAAGTPGSFIGSVTMYWSEATGGASVTVV